MIAKITYGADVAGCAEYDIDKAKDARVILANGLPLTTDIEQIQTLFNIQASLSSRVEKPVMHIALSFSRADGHVYKTGFERSRSVKACRAITEMYGLTMGEGRSNINEQSLKEPDRSRQMLYREIKGALDSSRSSRDFWNALRQRGVDTLPRYKDGAVVGYSFEMDNTCRMSGGKISREFTKGNLTRTLREMDQAPKRVLVIPRFDDDFGTMHRAADVFRNEEAIPSRDTASDFFDNMFGPSNSASVEQDIRRKEEERKRRKRGMRM